ncbi:hypothetical protein HFN98_28805 [Rhizobium laguerreae]|uniref:hypothetical protein n=1 Tax=Rhizobium laguerreae TaxID=1076926 RepID=UPI001C9135BF|nr:hypothetical protein [Rhizobium laguerreae]MBY3334581.1 hypothetical protein [Rhizobium laguerreae]
MSETSKAERRRTREQAEADEHHKRWHDLWNVPERARDEYIRMEDRFGPETVLEFIKAMLPEEVEA